MTNPILKRFIVLSAVIAAAVIVICCIIGLIPPSPVAPVSHLTGTDGNPTPIYQDIYHRKDEP